MILRNKINISLVIFLISSILFILFLIYPLFKDIKKNSRELILKKEETILLEDRIKNIEEFRENYRQINPNLEKINTLFVDSKIPIEFIDFLEKISRDCQMTIKISPSSAAKVAKEPWLSINFQINVAGSFPNLLKFIDKLESSKYLIEIKNLNISHLTEAELRLIDYENFSSGDIKASLILKVYAK